MTATLPATDDTKQLHLDDLRFRHIGLTPRLSATTSAGPAGTTSCRARRPRRDRPWPLGETLRSGASARLCRHGARERLSERA
jgi:hypothetical protein